MIIATIDSGTTNTRVRIWKDDNILSEAKRSVGVRNTACDGNNKKLIKGISESLQDAIKCANLEKIQIDLILAAGMLTSNLGIVEIPHKIAPLSFKQLANSMISYKIQEISDKPIWFVPGVKNIKDELINDYNISEMDIMRGEETEAAGILLKRKHINEQTILVLPGSHNKYIFFNEEKDILGCTTTMAGELLQSLTFNTILSDCLNHNFASEFRKEYFRKGVNYRNIYGLGHACFMARILSLFSKASYIDIQNYILGVILEDDIESLRNNKFFKQMNNPMFIISGNSVIQQAYECLLKYNRWKYELISEDEQHGLSGYGAISLARLNNLME